MVFTSPEYLFFLPAVLGLYYCLSFRLQNYLLLAASYFFYGFWDARFLSLIALVTGISYAIGWAIDRSARVGQRRCLLILGLLASLGLLGVFKYCNFFLATAIRALSTLGLAVDPPLLYILLPVGISFYTFQSMAYMIEVYRRQIRPTANVVDYALYVAYFPQLVAGPIERPQHLLPSLQTPRRVTSGALASGALLILIGLFRKLFIADGVAPQVDQAFAAPGTCSTPELAAGAYLFALQIYCDFAGYSDIARGSSRLFGIELMQNFRQPYFATNLAEFWRRWHISLSTWLRDYLYVPLGGNRYGRLRTYRNLMATMTLGGLWHGAALSFLAWGGLHGCYLVAYRALQGVFAAKPWPRQRGVAALRRAASWCLTFHLVVFTFVLFRASGLRAGLDYLGQLASGRDMDALPAAVLTVAVPWMVVLLIDVPQQRAGRDEALLTWPAPLRHAAVAVLLFLTLLAIGSRAPFIYFQF